MQHSSRKGWHKLLKANSASLFQSDKVPICSVSWSRPQTWHNRENNTVILEDKCWETNVGLPFVCPCAVLHPRRGDMRPTCWKQSCGTVISRWCIKLGSGELCPSKFPHRRQEAWPGCPKASEILHLAWPLGAYKTDWHLEKLRGFSKMCPTSALTQGICRY